MSMFFTIAVIILVFLIIFQVAKASEYVSVIKGEEKSRKQQNKVNGFFMIAFLIAGLIGVYYCNKTLYPETLLSRPAASVQGEKVDSMMWVTIIITGTVFFITQFALFYFNFKYQESDKRKDQPTARRITSGSNWRHLKRPQTEEARRSIRLASK